MKLLSGQVNIFYEGVYKGKTLIDVTSISDTLKISVGIDQSVKVEYEDLSKQHSKINSSKKKRLVDLTYRIKNNKAEKINILLNDQIPISYMKQLEVEVLDKGSASIEKKTGFVSWNLHLNGREIANKNLSYMIKYPEKIRVEID